MKMISVIYDKEELRNRTYEIPEMGATELLPYLSEWLADFIIKHSNEIKTYNQK